MSLVGWWPLHRTSGDAIDLSGNGNDGTVNGVTRGVAGRGGLTAGSFDGTDDYVSIPDSSSLEPPKLTISAWIKATGDIDADYTNTGLIGKWGNANGDQYLLWTETDGAYNIQMSVQSGSRSDATIDRSRLDSDWHHIVGTFDTSSSIYLDGILVERGADIGEGYNSGTNNLILGNYGDLAKASDVDMVDVRLYDRVLSAEEIQELYEYGAVDVASPPGNPEGGVSYYPFDGTTATDEWDGNADGTLNSITTEVDGIRNEGFEFDGSTSYVDLGGSSSLIPLPEFTMTVWVRNDNPGTSGYWLDSNEGSDGGFTIQLGGYLRVSDGATFDDGPNAEFVEVPGWSHLAVTWDNNSQEMDCYQNGEFLNTASFSNGISYSGNTAFWLGREHGTNDVLDGVMDEFRIYNRKLRPAEVFELYQYGTRGRDMRKFTVNQ